MVFSIAAATMSSSSSSSPSARQFQFGHLRQQPQEQQQKRTIGTIVFYLLMACSTILLVRSYQLQSYRVEELINNTVTKIAVRRILPEEDMYIHQANKNVNSNNNNNNNKNKNDNMNNRNDSNKNDSGYFVPSLDFRIKGISQYSDGINFEAHVYCEEFEKELMWEWWRPSRSSGANNRAKDGQQKEQTERLLQREELRIGTEGDSNGETTTMISATSTINTSTPTGARKRLLIGISGGYDNHARFLERAVWSARVYGAVWSRSINQGNKNDNDDDDDNNNHEKDLDVTILTLQGTAFSPHGCKAPLKYSGVGKIRLLFKALDLSPHRYDRLLILDANAMMYNMDVDVTALISSEGDSDGDNNDDHNDFIVAGPPILKDGEEKSPWKIGSGMMLWNLKHPLTPSVALDWFNFAKDGIIRGTYLGDQKYLHKSLFYNNVDKDVRVLSHQEFSDDINGKIIKQFVSHANEKTETKSHTVVDAHDIQLDARLERMEETARQICARHPDACKEVGQPPRYETS